MEKRYYFFFLEVALRKRDDHNIYAYENVSHVPTNKLVEIFNIKLNRDPHILEGYFLTKSRYKTHKKYFDQHFPAINLDLFEYCLRQYAASEYSSIRRLYKEDLME